MQIKIFYKKFLDKPIKIQFKNNKICIINGFLTTMILKLKLNHFYTLTSTNCYLIHKNYIRTFFSVLTQIIKGITFGYKICLLLKGKGLRLQLKKYKNQNFYIFLKLGYSHKIFFYIPKNTWIFITSKRRTLILYSFNYTELKLLTSKIRNFYPLSLYKLRGFFEETEITKLKKGKSRLNSGNY